MLFGFLSRCVERFQLFLEQSRLFHDSSRVLPGLLELSDFFTELVTLRFQLFRFRNALAATSVNGEKIPQQRGGVLSAGAQFFFDQRQVGPYKCEIEHRLPAY